jgi:CheY-like chemotaxis protein
MAKILLVEDNEFNRDMLSRRLIKNGFQIALAVDGVESLQLARTGLPDLILMDMSLPVMDGWEATLQLKSDPVTCDIPVIALTAHAMGQDKQKALNAGCDDYDTKPIELSRLLSKIHKFLE